MQPRDPAAAFAQLSLLHVEDLWHWSWQMFSCEYSQNFVARDRQIFHALADRIEYGIGDSGNSGYFARLADALSAKGAVSVVAFDEYHLDFRSVPVGHDARAVESCRQRLTCSPVVEQVFV